MRSRIAVTIGIVVLLACFALPFVHAADRPTASTEGREGVEGIWEGALKVKTIELRVVFHISAKPDGTLAATMDSPDQGATGIPVDTVTFEKGVLRLESKLVQGVFEGTVSADGSAAEGTWTQPGALFPLLLRRVEKAPELPRRPQEPKKPYPYNEEEVVYENEEAGIKLTGTLTWPRSEGPFPAVLLITGSGPQDRNETLLGHKPFLVLADYLTRKGIAVLRVDDRGIRDKDLVATFFNSTGEDFAGDALTGVRYLKSRKEINPKQIGLIGHSEGGLVAPMAAVQSPDVAFIVLMAGPGLVGEELLYLQASAIFRALGASDELLAWQRALAERQFALLKEEKDSAAAERGLRKLEKDAEAELSEEDRKLVDSLGSTLESDLKMMVSPWFRHFLTYDPKPTLMKVNCPVLAIIGELDLQVPPKENLPAIEEALKAGGNEHYTVKELPGLNHLFQTAHTGALSEYAKIEETISPTALKIIADWVLEQTKER